VLAGAGASAVARRAIPAIVTAIGACALSIFAPSFAVPGLDAQQDAVSLCDRAEASLRTGRTDEAIALYRRAERLDPAYAFAPLDLGKALSASGDRAGAEAAIRRAIQLDPGLSEARYDLGVLLYESGRLEEAAAAFADAARLDPWSADAANNLLGTLLRLDRAPEALEAWRAMRSRGLPVDPPLESRLREIERP
jgi:tetratricopeptide (TPR) repeat protein